MRMDGVLPGAGGSHSQTSFLELPQPPLPPHPSSDEWLLTVGKVGPLVACDRDCDGGFLPIACPANIFSSIRWGGLEDVQAGAADLASHDGDIRGLPGVQQGLHTRLLGCDSYVGYHPQTLPHSRSEYLMPGRQAAPTLVPCDLCMGLSCHHTVEIQCLTLSHGGG